MKSLKQFIYSELEKGNHLNDSDVFKFRQREEDIITATDYKDQWQRLNRDREWFADKDIAKLHNYRREYHAQIRGMDYWMKISKAYYNEILPQFTRDNSRPDLKDVYDWYK